MVTAEAPISLNVIKAQAEKLLSQAPVLVNLEVFGSFAHQRLQARLGKNYVFGLGRGRWSPDQQNTDFGRVGVVRALLDPGKEFDPLTNYFVTTLTANWKQDKKQADWSLEVVQEERGYLPQLKTVTITSPKGSGRFIPAELAQS